ncbi:MAG: TerB family tellurite resistance protein, partial [Microcystis sp.]
MKNKQLLKILIGVAWIDGVIQPSERSYLRQVAVREKLDDDLEIKPLLSELKPVKTSEFYRWLESY